MIKGIKAYRKKNSLVFIIETISDELKDAITTNLSAICQGADKANRNPRLYSYHETLKEFLLRYESKDAKTQKGMIGELLSHIIFLHYKKGFLPISPFFNMEERSIKKGFDILYIEPAYNNKLWITEVKAGNRGRTLCSRDKNSNLIQKAKRDLNSRLNSEDVQIWHNAINGAATAIKSSNIKDEILKILEDMLEEQACFTSQDKNVILTSVLFNDVTDRIILDDVIESRQKILDEAMFNEIMVVSIQKNTYQAVVNYLKEEIA